MEQLDHEQHGPRSEGTGGAMAMSSPCMYCQEDSASAEVARVREKPGSEDCDGTKGSETHVY